MHLVAPATQLRDSKDLLGDAAALRARIATDGYVLMRALLDPALVSAVGRAGLAALQTAGWTEAGPDPVRARPLRPVRAVRMRDAMGDPGYREILADPGFNSLPFVTPLADLMAQILGPAGFCYPMKLPRIVYPCSLAPRQPGNYIHRDYRSVQDMFTAWVPLEAVPTTLGGLALEAGSHRRAPDRARYRSLDHLEPGWLTTDYLPGDVLVFHCLTTHAALPNRARQLRFSAEYRWQLADQPAPRRMVVGRHGQEIGRGCSAGPPGGTPYRRDCACLTTGTPEPEPRGRPLRRVSYRPPPEPSGPGAFPPHLQISPSCARIAFDTSL